MSNREQQIRTVFQVFAILTIAIGGMLGFVEEVWIAGPAFPVVLLSCVISMIATTRRELSHGMPFVSVREISNPIYFAVAMIIAPVLLIAHVFDARGAGWQYHIVLVVGFLFIGVDRAYEHHLAVHSE